MSNINTQSTKSAQSKSTPVQKPSTTVPRPAPSQGQNVSKGGKRK